MKYIRTKNGKIIDLKKLGCSKKVIDNPLASKDLKLVLDTYGHGEIVAQADTIEELCDEIVLIENGDEHNVVYLQEAYDRIDEYHNQGNYEPRLIGRIKVGLDKKAVAEWKENEQGFYDWVLLYKGELNNQ